MRALAVVPMFAVTLVTGCAHHVVIDRPPAASAPLEVRTAYVDDHALDKARRGDLVLRTRLFDSRPTVARRHAELRNGLPIERVEDLRPLVKDGTATAQAMDVAVDARGRADALTGGGVAVAGLGLVAGGLLFAIDLGVLPGTAQTPTQEQVAPPLVIAGISSAAVGAVLGGVLVALGSMARDQEDAATTSAFDSYDRDLRAALALDAAP